MLVRTDPFRELDRVATQVFGTTARPAVMPMDAWRDGDTFVIEFDLPAVDPDSVDLDVERNVLTVRAERLSPTGPDVELIASERPRGVFSRQVILGDALDTDGGGPGWLELALPTGLTLANGAYFLRVWASNGGQVGSAQRAVIFVAR